MSAGTRIAFFLASLCFGIAGEACELTYSQLQSKALTILKKSYPNETFSRGRTPDVVRMGEIELGLQSLRSRLCLTPKSSATERNAHIQEYFDTTIDLLKAYDKKLPESWGAAESKVRLQLMHADYLSQFRAAKVLVVRQFVPGVYVAVVLDQPRRRRALRGHPDRHRGR